MTVTPECLVCLYGQVLKATKLLKFEKEEANRLLLESASILSKYTNQHTPPQIAKELYEHIAKRSGLYDPLKVLKEHSLQEAKKLIPFAQSKIGQSRDKLYAALKASVAGNVIDFAAKAQFDLEKTLLNVFENSFSVDNSETLKEALATAKKVVILGDNAGENLFDELLVKTLHMLYSLDIYYIARSKPVINDISYDEIVESDMANLATVISGAPTPGFDLGYASKESLDLFYSADVVISKGMGNYESLDGVAQRKVYFLFKVKCDVVAQSAGREVGDIVLL